MAHFWFTSAPLPGHLDWGGLLKTAQALQALGHDVVWVSEAQIGPLVEHAGIPFAAVEVTGWLWPPPPLPTMAEFVNENMVTLRFRRALDTWLSEDLVAQGTAALCDLARRIDPPDVIVSDPFLASAALAAERLDVPLVVGGWASGPPVDEDELLYVQRQLGHEASERIERLAAQFGISGVNFSGGPAPSIQSPAMHVSYFNAFWHQGETVLPQTVFVGGRGTPPATPVPDWLAALDDVPLGMVTLGSTFTSDLNFFAWGAQAIAAAGLVPLVVLGPTPVAPEQKERLKANLPGGTRLLTWVDYAHVFPRLKVLIHHGGMGTTHAAIVHGIPQVIVPHAADQRGQARRARQAKVGLELGQREVWQGQLVPAVQAITTTDWVLDAVQSLARDFAALGGPDRAAALLAEVAGG